MMEIHLEEGDVSEDNFFPNGGSHIIEGVPLSLMYCMVSYSFEFTVIL